jgi:transcription elongation factor Elf1
MTTATKTRQGFDVTCPHCGEERTIAIDADDVDCLRCKECETEFTRDDIRDIIGKWQALLAWLDTAPVIGN